MFEGNEEQVNDHFSKMPSAKDIKIETNRDGSRVHVFFTLEAKDQAEKLQK